jgi:hypothetical protein
LAKAKGNSKIIRFAFISLWIVGWVSVLCLGASIVKDFKTTNDIVEQEIVLSNPGVNSIEFTAPDDIIVRNHKNRFLRFSAFRNITDEDTVYINNVHFRILKSPNDSFHLSIIKQADGATIKEAESIASLIDYSVKQIDSIIRTPIGIAVSKKNKFRNQRVTLTISVPVGKKIRINQSIWDNTTEGTISFYEEHQDSWEDYWGNEEKGWTTNVDYIMKADGLYTMEGNRVNSEGARREKGLDGKDYRKFRDEVMNAERLSKEAEKEAAKQNSLDSIEQKIEKEKDSLNRMIEEKKVKEKEKILKQESQPSAYSTPIGLPIINSLM